MEQLIATKQLENFYHIECYGRAERKRDVHGRFYWVRPLKWVEDVRNLVVTAGLNDSLDKHLKGSAYTAAWYVGLTDGTPAFAAGDTMSSHAGWVEDQNYSEAVRQTLTLGTVSGGSVDNSASKAVFSINATTTIGGAFVTSVSTKGGSTGTLYGGAAFSADRSVQNGDTLNVTVTCTAAAS